MKKIFLSLLLVSLVFMNCLCSFADVIKPKNTEDACECPPSLGKAPDFQLKDLDGKEVKLSDFRGKGVILFFWASWCVRCKDHLPEINQIYGMLKDKNIELLAIDVGETAKKVKRFMKKNPIDFPVLLDVSQSVSQSYVVVGVPTFIVMDKDGYLKFQNHFWPYDYEKYLCE